jgi:hypothetical protein
MSLAQDFGNMGVLSELDGLHIPMRPEEASYVSLKPRLEASINLAWRETLGDFASLNAELAIVQQLLRQGVAENLILPVNFITGKPRAAEAAPAALMLAAA